MKKFVLIILGLLIFWFFYTMDYTKPAPIIRPKETIISIQLPPPIVIPPLPKPPEIIQEPKKEEMIEQEKPKENETKPEEPKKPLDEPPPISTNNIGKGSPDAFGLGMGGNGIGGNGSGTKGNGGSKFGWFASKLQSDITNFIRNNKELKYGNMSEVVRIWLDNTGRIIKVNCESEILKNELIGKLQMIDSPPNDMPMPIVLKINIHR